MKNNSYETRNTLSITFDSNTAEGLKIIEMPFEAFRVLEVKKAYIENYLKTPESNLKGIALLVHESEQRVEILFSKDLKLDNQENNDWDYAVVIALLNNNISQDYLNSLLSRIALTLSFSEYSLKRPKQTYSDFNADIQALRIYNPVGFILKTLRYPFWDEKAAPKLFEHSQSRSIKCSSNQQEQPSDSSNTNGIKSQTLKAEATGGTTEDNNNHKLDDSSSEETNSLEYTPPTEDIVLSYEEDDEDTDDFPDFEPLPFDYFESLFGDFESLGDIESCYTNKDSHEENLCDNTDKSKSPEEELDAISDSYEVQEIDVDIEDIVFTCEDFGKNVSAKALFNPKSNKMLVLKGSKFSKEYDGLNDSYKNSIQKLLEDGFLQEKDDFFELIVDHEFNSPSMTVSVALGSHTRAMDAWKSKYGTLGEVKTSLKQRFSSENPNKKVSATATYYPKTKAILVHEGSRFSQNIIPCLTGSKAHIEREVMIKDGLLVPEDDYYILTDDYLFNSVSTASMILNGTGGGRKVWINSYGEDIAEAYHSFDWTFGL